ncbi:MAG: S-methyl-5'-thioadenosine phosphorylase [Bauldia sp.]
MTRAVLGIIGGSGVYDLPGVAEARWETVETPWGAPSDQIRVGLIGALKIAFLPRHGRGHRLSPSAINYRANIDALKRLGVTDVVSVSACGSLNDDLPPGMLVVVDQFIDRTFARAKTFFGEGCVAHVSMADPVSPLLADRIARAAAAEGIPHRRGGTYVAIEGPQFSTRAEARMHRAWGADVVGMTNMPEAKLAREAELCYAALAMVTDHDCWRPDYGTSSVDEIVRVVVDNADKVRRVLLRLAGDFPAEHEPCPIGSDRSLDHALITAVGSRDPDLVARLDAVAGRVLRGRSA